jgi:chromosome segregation ATPase
MITKLALEAQTTNEKWNQFKQAERNTKAVEQLTTSLDTIHSDVQQLEGVYQLLTQSDKVDKQRLAEIRTKIKPLRDSFRNLRSEYTENLTQIPQKVQANHNLQLRPIKNEVQQVWRAYILAERKPLLELYNMVKLLPEIKARSAKIEHELQKLDEYKQSLPKNANEVHSLITSLQQQLASAESLPPKIQAFLRQAASGGITLAAVDDEILAWCRQDNRAEIFRIIVAERAE